MVQQLKALAGLVDSLVTSTLMPTSIDPAPHSPHPWRGLFLRYKPDHLKLLHFQL